MNAGAATLVVYLLHYLLARLLYDRLLRPLGGAGVGAVVLEALAISVALVLVARALRRSRR